MIRFLIKLPGGSYTEVHAKSAANALRQVEPGSRIVESELLKR